MTNSTLNKARQAKNDEFYTQWTDIEKEIMAYIEYDPNIFLGKTILLPCDDPEWSNFTKFFAQNFKAFGIKKLISTSYAFESKKFNGTYQPSLFETNSPQFNPDINKIKGKIFTLEYDTNKNNTIDIENLKWEYLKGDGDFRSEEVKKLRNEADIIITNPPFSLFREFLTWITETDKQFAIIGNMNAITYKEVFPLIKNNKLWLGASIYSGDREFGVPDSYPINASGWRIDNNGNKFIRVKGVRWFTNIEHGRRYQPLQLMTMADNIKYSKHKEVKNVGYQKYDNYDAIEVPYTDAIPIDYNGVMGVPISFLDKYCPEQFEIVTFRKGEDDKDLVFTREREREYNLTFESLFNINSRDNKELRRKDKWEDYLHKNYNSKEVEPIDCFYPIATNLANGLVSNCTIQGKRTYVRILIQKRDVK